MNQKAIDYKLNSELITPFPRRILLLFGLIISAYVMVVFALDDSLNFLWGVMLASIGFFSLFIYTKRRRRYYTPLIITIFYFMGYLLSSSNILLNKVNISRTGFGAIGSFMFTDSNFLTLFLVIFAGMSGIMTVTLIAEKIFRHGRFIFTSKEMGSYFLPKKQLCMWICLWFCFSVVVLIVMWHLEIGCLGLKPKTRLPFRLVGLFIYLRSIFIPFCGLLFLDICLRSGWKRLGSMVLVLLIIIGIIGSLSAASRGVVVFTVFPAILFLLFTSRGNNLSQKLFVRFFAISFICTLVVIFIVGFERNIAYGTISWNLSDAKNLLTNLNLHEFDFLEAVVSFMALATDRIGGIRDLMAVASSNVSGIEIPVKLFMGTLGRNLSSSICYSVKGFNPITSGGLAFGITYGMWGQLFLSKSYLAVYLGTVLLVGIIICLEEVFLRKGLHSVALLVSILLGIQFWGTASMFILSRFVVMLLICYLTSLYFLKKIRRASRKAVPMRSFESAR